MSQKLAAAFILLRLLSCGMSFKLKKKEFVECVINKKEFDCGLTEVASSSTIFNGRGFIQNK